MALPRSESMASGSSVIIAAEELRQRYVRHLGRDDGRDFQTNAHKMTSQNLANALKAKLSANCKCDTGPCGLKAGQAASSQKLHGHNRITPPKRENPWIKLLKLTFTGVFNLLLWSCVAAEVALIVFYQEEVEEGKPEKEADFVTPSLLSFVIVSAALLQWYTEMQAEALLDSLTAMQSKKQVRVVRQTDDGSRDEKNLDPDELVPGDVIFLEAGMKIPADVRIVFCADETQVDNSALTGESMPEVRTTVPASEETPAPSATNLAFFGTSVLQGSATAVVFATGDSTMLGKIASAIAGGRTKSTLEVQIEHFVHTIAGVAVAVGLLSLWANLSSPIPRQPQQILENAASALFAQVPEGLLPTVTISLLIASQQMEKRNVLIRKLDAIETLGCVSIICSDKTGTLTSGEMTATDVVLPDGTRYTIDDLMQLQSEAPPTSSELLTCGLLNNGAKVEGSTNNAQAGMQRLHSKSSMAANEWTETWKLIGSPTEVAILRASIDVLGGSHIWHDMRVKYPTKFEIPFNSDNKWMLTVHAPQDVAYKADKRPYKVIVKGAPERVLDLCARCGAEEMTPQQRRKLDTMLQELMSEGRRVLCLATKTVQLPAGHAFEGSKLDNLNFDLKTGLSFCGLIGIEDPPKEGVREAVTAAHHAGVRVIMVTGDHPETAKAIARRLGIAPEENDKFTAVTGSQIDKMMPNGDDFLEQEQETAIMEFWHTCVTKTCVFARVSPIHKQVIVQAYQQLGGREGTGEVVAMTGDGVNDAPALKQAQVGLAMGIRGTDVAKDAADIVLLDDNFASIIQGMEQGRLAAVNLQKSIMYTLCSKIPQVAPTFAELLGVPQALKVTHVLLVDIGTDIVTAIAYAVQASEADLMHSVPRPMSERLVGWRVLMYSYGYFGWMQMACCWATFFLVPGIQDLMSVPADEWTAEERLVDVQGMTAYYWALVAGQLAAAVCTTTKSQSLFSYGLPNGALNVCIVFEVALALAAVYWGPMQGMFQTASLGWQSIVLPVGLALVLCLVEEARKAIVRPSGGQAGYEPLTNGGEPLMGGSP